MNRSGISNIGRVLLTILGATADVTGIALVATTHFSAPDVNLPKFSLVLLWCAVMLTYVVVMILFLDELRIKWTITIPFYLFFLNSTALHRENKFFFFSFVVILLSIFIIEPLSIGITFGGLIVCLLFGSFFVGITIEHDMEKVKAKWKDISEHIVRSIESKKMFHVNDIRTICAIYEISPISLFSVLKRFVGLNSSKFAYGFYHSSKERTSFRVFINMDKIRRADKVIP